MAMPPELEAALRPVTVVVGHYGAGKTNFSVNLATDLAAAGHKVSLIDLDVVNPYFRASEQRKLLEERGVHLIAPVFAEAGTSLDVPSLTGEIAPAIQGVREGEFAIIDAGGDDVGATALGRYARFVKANDPAVLYIANRFRNLVQDIDDAVENMREIEEASHLKVTAIVNNSHLKQATEAETIELGVEYADELSAVTGIPVACTTVPPNMGDRAAGKLYPVECFVRSPWE